MEAETQWKGGPSFPSHYPLPCIRRAKFLSTLQGSHWTTNFPTYNGLCNMFICHYLPLSCCWHKPLCMTYLKKYSMHQSGPHQPVFTLFSVRRSSLLKGDSLSMVIFCSQLTMDNKNKVFHQT